MAIAVIPAAAAKTGLFSTQTLTTAAAVAGLASGVASAAGALQSGRGDQQQAELQARVQAQQGQRDKELADREADRIRRDSSRILARQRALLGSSGVSVEGTPLLVMGATAAEGELQARLAEAGGETANIRARQQAELTRLAGRNRRRASFFRAGSSLLQGGATFGAIRAGLPAS